ncbi:MAG: glucose/mannose-6-phosphate isomerase [Actinobacteria bacterium]|nr:glucose/mannose-6-phosphate isomerase [Actinomycetota bacterium]
MNPDDMSSYGKLDPSGMLALMKEFPSQCRTAWRQAHEFKLPSGYRGIRKVVIAGMGGSAIAGDLLQSIIEPEGIPVIYTATILFLRYWIRVLYL